MAWSGLFLQETLKISIYVEGDRQWWKFSQLAETVSDTMASVSVFHLASSDSKNNVENYNARISFEVNSASWSVPRFPF